MNSNNNLVKNYYKFRGELKVRLRGIIDYWKIIPFILKRNKFNFNPVFIIGCGRSGTSILGNTLALHKSICYLHERRDLWRKAYPELDIWSGKYQHPLLYADEKDQDIYKTKKLRSIFFKEQVAGNCKVLLEKLPINSFRLKFLQACFPEAKYIYLHRNGLEVAESISKKIPVSWFGYKNLKWNLLVNHAKKNGFIFSDDELASNLHKGIFEWRLSMEQSEAFFKTLSNEKYICISYKDLIENSFETLSTIFRFLQLETTESFLKKISATLERKNKKIDRIEDEITWKIGGDLLRQSLNK